MPLLIFYAFLTVFISFLCSITEAALLSFTPAYIRVKEKEGKKFARFLKSYKEDIDRPLIAILTLNTIAHTVGSILVGVQAAKIYGEGNNAVGIVSAAMTFLILVLSEIIPKTIGASYWKSLGYLTARFLRIIIFVLKYTGLQWLFMLLTRVVGKSNQHSKMSKEEFIALTDTAEEEGVFQKTESKFIKQLLVYKNVMAQDIMTPFSVTLTEEVKLTLAEFHQKHKILKFSRIPVYKEHRGNIVGFVLKDTILEELVNGNDHKTLGDLTREVLITQSDTSIQGIFDSLLEERAHISVVTDEYGNTVGVVTMEDIIETLLGLEIMDEYDSIKDMQVLARKNWEKRAKELGIIEDREENAPGGIEEEDKDQKEPDDS